MAPKEQPVILDLPPHCPSCGRTTERVDHTEPDAPDIAMTDGLPSAILQVWPADPDDEHLPESWLWLCPCGFQAEPTAELAGSPPTVARMLGTTTDRTGRLERFALHLMERVEALEKPPAPPVPPGWVKVDDGAYTITLHGCRCTVNKTSASGSWSWFTSRVSDDVIIEMGNGLGLDEAMVCAISAACMYGTRQATPDPLASVNIGQAMTTQEKIQRRLSAKRARKVAPRPPRYDEVFYRGTAWLDGGEE